MTTTELIKLLQDTEKGGISHRSRQVSLTVNGRYLPDPQITLSSTGDGIAGPEIDLDVNGEWLEHEVDEIDEVLNKIRAEIEKVVWEDVIVSFNGTDETRIPRLDPDDVFEIIDRYKAESKGKYADSN